MNKTVLEKLSMVQSVLNTVNSHPDIITSSPALGAAMAQLQTKKDEVNSIIQAYSASSSWRTVEKDKLLKTAVDQTDTLVRIMRAYAKSVNDENLYYRMGFTKTELRAGGISNTLLCMKEVMDEAAVVLPDLAAFSYNETRFASLTQLFTDLELRKVAPRNAISEHKALGESLKQGLRAISDILEFQIDAIIAAVKVDNEAFCVQYRSSRKTIHHGGKYGSKPIPPQPDDGDDV